MLTVMLQFYILSGTFLVYCLRVKTERLKRRKERKISLEQPQHREHMRIQGTKISGVPYVPVYLNPHVQHRCL